MKFQAKHVILTVAAAALLAAGTLLLVYRERTISVVEHLGDVLISKVLIRKEIGVYDGMRMEQGDEIRTGERARAVLELDEVKLLRLSGNTAATFEELSGDIADNITLVFLKAGTVFSDIAQKLAEGSSYTVNTPNATVSVRGTYFSVSVTQDPATGKPVTVVNVYHGKVRTQYTDEAGQLQTVDVEQGQKITIADRVKSVERKLDFSDFDEQELKRLIALAQEQSTGYTIEEVEERLHTLETSAGGSGAEEPPGIVQVTAAEFPGGEAPAGPDSGSAPGEAPAASEASAPAPPPGIDGLPGNVKGYAAYPAEEMDISRAEKAKAEYEALSSQAKGLSSEQQKDIGYEKVVEGLEKIKRMESAKEAAGLFNALPQPAETTLDDRAAVEGARKQMDQTDGQVQQYLPESIRNKLRDCEEYLGLSIRCAELIDGLDPGSPDRAALDEAVSLFTRLGDAQKKALGADRHDKLDSMYKKTREKDPAYVPEALSPPTAAQAAASGAGRELVASDVKREGGVTSVKKDITIQVESEKAQPARTVASKLGEEFEVAACYDVRLVARDSSGGETEVQPTHPVRMRMQVPDRFGDTKSFLIWHVFGEEQIEPVPDYQIERDGTGTYLSFSVDHFSQFIVAAPKEEAIWESKDVVEVKVEETSQTMQGAVISMITKKNITVAALYALSLLILGILAFDVARQRGTRSKGDAR